MMTIRADYNRPICPMHQVILPSATAIDAIIETLDENDTSCLAVREYYYGSYAQDVEAETARAAIELAAPEFLPAVKEMLDFAVAHKCKVTIERPDPDRPHPVEITGVRLNPIPAEEPQYDWATTHAQWVFEQLGYTISTSDSNAYPASDVIARARRMLNSSSPFRVDDVDLDNLILLAEFAIAKSGPDARVLVH